MITEIVSAAGAGAESLRRGGTDVVLEACVIEVTLDEHPIPAAQVSITFTERSGPPQPT
jgi:hypothetical protein